MRKRKKKFDLFSGEQKQFINMILKSAVENNCLDMQRYYFIEGQGGTGKTFVYSTIYHLLKAENKSLYYGTHWNCSYFTT